MAKKGKGKGFLGAVGSFFGSIPAVKSVKKAAKSVKKKVKKAKKKLKKVVKKAKKRLKKKIGKVFTKARKLKNKLSKSKLVKKVKRAAKKVVLAGKKAVKKGKKYAKAAVKVVKKTAKKVAVAAKKVNVREAISTAADFIPVVGNVKSAYEAIVGKDPITGRKLDKWERAVSAAGIVGGPAVKGAKKIGGAAVEGFVNAGKKGSKTKPPTTGKKSAAAAPKKPPSTTGGQKVATAAPKKPPATGGQKVATAAPKKPPATGGQKLSKEAPKKPPATGGQKVSKAAPKKPNPNNNVQQKVAYKEPPKKPNQVDTPKTRTVYKDSLKSDSQVNSLPKAVGMSGTPTSMAKVPTLKSGNKEAKVNSLPKAVGETGSSKVTPPKLNKDSKTPAKSEEPNVNSTNRIIREATEGDKKLVDDVYKKYQASTKRKNAAVTKGKIGSDNINLESISGQIDPKNPHHKGNFTKPDDNAYVSRDPVEQRINDSEQKMIEHLREKYKDKPDISGEIEIISDREICNSCNDIIDQFQEEFKNINITRIQIKN